MRKQKNEGAVAKKARQERETLLNYFASCVPISYRKTLSGMQHLTLTEMKQLHTEVEERRKEGREYQRLIMQHMAW